MTIQTTLQRQAGKSRSTNAKSTVGLVGPSGVSMFYVHCVRVKISTKATEDTETPVLKICFGPPTAESKNLKNHVNFDVGDLFFRSPALWSSQNVFGPPTAGRAVVDIKDRGLSSDLGHQKQWPWEHFSCVKAPDSNLQHWFWSDLCHVHHLYRVYFKNLEHVAVTNLHFMTKKWWINM